MILYYKDYGEGGKGVILSDVVDPKLSGMDKFYINYTYEESYGYPWRYKYATRSCTKDVLEYESWELFSKECL